MRVKKSTIDAEQLSKLIVEGMKEKKAVDIVVLNMKKIKNSIADFFVICSGNSDTQVDAITDSIEEQVYKHSSQEPWHKEGKENKEWILLDYVDVVAHVFKKDRREFYALEDLWGDAAMVKIDPEVKQS